jgi:hypothetical protein
MKRVENSPNHVGYSGVAAAEFSEDTELPGILDAIATDVQRVASAARHAVMAEYAGKVTHARRHLPRAQVAGAVRAFREARAAALTHIARQASAEISARRRGVSRARHSLRRIVPPSRPDPSDHLNHL